MCSGTWTKITPATKLVSKCRGIEKDCHDLVTVQVALISTVRMMLQHDDDRVTAVKVQ